MVGTQQIEKAVPGCTLCPAGCEMQAAAVGPGLWRGEVPFNEPRGLCARGLTLGELLSGRGRILWPGGRRDGRIQPLPAGRAAEAVLEAAAGAEVIVFLDGNVPCEQVLGAAAWCGAWPAARLCLVVEPAEEAMLLGAEASGAERLSEQALAGCDAFVVVGGAMAANPRCSRAIFERREANPRTPIVVIDPGGGSAVKFASHRVDVGPGMEWAALSAVAAAAGVQLAGPQVGESPSSAAAGRALAGAKRLGVILAAEYGRSGDWGRVGYLAGRLAAERGGGVACQTDGANALAAVRLARRLQTLPLVEAVGRHEAAWIVVGCDLLGMLGWSGRRIVAAAAALPNTTTEAAEFVLPLSLPAEWGGTYLLDGARAVQVQPLLAPPAGVSGPVGVIEQLARCAGVGAPEIRPCPPPLEPLPVEEPQGACCAMDPGAPALLFGRQAQHAGCGALTGHGSWQATAQDLPDLRVSPQDAEAMGLSDLRRVQVRAGRAALGARVRVSRELSPGVVVLPEGFAEARSLSPAAADTEGKSLIARPVSVSIEV